jgi:hypothetical protein
MEKYKLTKKEIKNLDNYWIFIDIFSKPDLEELSDNWWDYKRKKNKNIVLFGAYEYRQYIIPKIRKLYTPEQFYFYEKILNKLLWNLLDKTKFDIEKIEKFHKNISIIMRNRKLYEYIIHKKKFDIKKKFNIKMYNLIDNKTRYTYYYSSDYPFPNVNFISYNKNKKKIWIDRIKKMYYKKKKISISKNHKNKKYNDTGWYNLDSRSFWKTELYNEVTNNWRKK